MESNLTTEPKFKVGDYVRVTSCSAVFSHDLSDSTLNKDKVYQVAVVDYWSGTNFIYYTLHGVPVTVAENVLVLLTPEERAHVLLGINPLTQEPL